MESEDKKNRFGLLEGIEEDFLGSRHVETF